MFKENFLMRLQYLLIYFYPFFWLGVGGKYPWILLGSHGIQIGYICFFSITLIFFILMHCPIDQWLKKHKTNMFQLVILIAGVFILFYDFIQYKHFAKVGYQPPHLLYMLDIINFMGTIFLLKKINRLFIWCSIFFILHLEFSIFYFPLTPLRSDMLPGINVTINNFLNHLYPYMKVLQDVGVIVYFPVTWISFLPLHILGLDLRLQSTILYLIIILIIGFNFKKLPLLNKYLICFWLLNPYLIMRHDMYFQLYLLELVIFAFYLHKLPRYLIIIIIGIFIATLQTALIVFPFLILAISKNIKQLIVNSIISIVIFGGIMWYLIGKHLPEYFTNVAFLQSAKNAPYNMDITFGLSPIFCFFPNQKILYIFQMITCLVIGLITLMKWYKRKNINYLAVAAYSSLFFVASNYFIETYLYIPVLLLIALIYSPNTIDSTID